MEDLSQWIIMEVNIEVTCVPLCICFLIQNNVLGMAFLWGKLIRWHECLSMHMVHTMATCQTNLNLMQNSWNLTPSLRRPFKPAILFWTADRRMLWTRIPFFESFVGSRVNTPLLAVTNVGWRVYTPVFLGFRGNTLRCPRTKGTAVSEWVLPNPFIHDLFCWSSRHKFVQTDL